MLTVGESLGKRFVVSRAPDRTLAGAILELTEQGSGPVLAQVLADGPVEPAVIPRIRPALAAIPASRVLLRAKEIVFTHESVPLALYDRNGLVPISSRLPDLVAQQGPRRIVSWLIQCVAMIARDLSRVHDADAAHGAISPDLILCQGAGPVDMAILSGFGIGPIRVNGDPSKRTSPRQDLVDLTTALAELFKRASVSPEGGLAAKWMVLRHSSMHGEHPALASGTIFAEALLDLARMPVGDDVAPARAARPASVAPPKGAAPSKAPPPSAAPVPDVGDVAPARKRMSPGTKVAAGLGVVAVLGLGYVAFRLNRDLFFNTPHANHRARRAQAGARCPGEQIEHLEGLNSEQPVQQFEAVCASGGGRMVVVARSGTNLLVSGRTATRGQRWIPLPTPPGARAVELGNLYARPDAEWVAWRNSVGSPLALSRFDGHEAHNVDVQLPGWEGQRLQGVHLLQVSDRAAFVATTLVGEANSLAMLLEVALVASDRPRVIAWLLGAGSVDAAIPAERPSVLVHARAGSRHILTSVTIDVAQLSTQLAPASPLAPAGTPMPEGMLRRSTELSIDAAALAFTPLGATAVDGALGYAATSGDLGTGVDCASTSAGCVTPGAVVAAVFPAIGSPTAVPVTTSAWAEDIQMQDSGGFFVMAAATAGGAVTRHQVFDMPSSTAMPSPRPVSLGASGGHDARLLGCGAEAWMLSSTANGAGAVVTGIPMGCARVP